MMWIWKVGHVAGQSKTVLATAVPAENWCMSLCCRLEEMYDAQEGPDDTEEDDSDFDPTGMVVTLTGSDLEASDWEEVCSPEDAVRDCCN